ncbi:gamma-glutamyltransferase [Martiniozyma asiatica (nom. inval.)]|nr:gamma-glutamyltransferase [Martiniozyma asiatica]
MHRSRNNLSKFLSINSKGNIILVIIFLIVAYESIVTIHRNPTHRKPFPKLPDAPAHVPFVRKPTWNPEYNTSSESVNGMVVSDSEICSKVGSEILKLGGNAADAAISTCLCIGTVDTMFSSGIGGGAFITSFKNGEAISIDSREMAPGAAYEDMFKNDELGSKFGGLSNAIPGELMGLWSLFKKHGSGKIKWKDLVLPVVDIAENGWLIDSRLQFALEKQRNALRYFNGDWEFVYREDGTLMKAGDLMQRPALAKTLRTIASDGVDAFYNPKGFIAKSLAKKSQQWGGILTAEDFGHYKPIIQKAISIDNFSNDNLTVYTANGVSSGLALAAGLKIFDSYNEFSKLNEQAEKFNSLLTHRILETMKWVASVRSNLGDVSQSQNKTEIKEHALRYSRFLSDEFIDHVLSKMNDNHTLPWQEYEPAYEQNDPHGTSSLSVVDKDGNAVTLTTTVNLLFGSCVHDPKTGIILNDEMDDFSMPHTKNAFGLSPSVFNFIEPYKRPLSSSSQSILVDSNGKVKMVIGAAGGSRIVSAVIQAIIRYAFQKLDIVNIIANPRIHHQLLPDIANIEIIDKLDDELVQFLTKKGHVVEAEMPQSAMNGIIVVNGVLWGQGDYWRKLGSAVGF